MYEKVIQYLKNNENKIEINNNNIKQFKQIYNLNEISNEVRQILSLFGNSPVYFEDERVVLFSFQQMIDADSTYNTNFVENHLIPISDLFDNDFVVYDIDNDCFSKYNSVDEVEFSKRKTLIEIFEGNNIAQKYITSSEQLLSKINQLFLEKKYDEELELINKCLAIHKSKNKKYTCYSGTDAVYFNNFLKIKTNNFATIEYNLLIIKCCTYIILKNIGEAEKVINELDKKVPNAAQVYSLKANVVKTIKRYIKLDDILNEQYNYIYDANMFAEFLRNKGIFYACCKKDYPTAVNYFSFSLKYNNGKDAAVEINSYLDAMKKSFNFNGKLKNYQDALADLQNKNLIALPAERNVEFSKYLYEHVLLTIKDNENYVKSIRENCVKMAGEKAAKEIENKLKK